jgi:diaminopimelate epimerase
MARIAFEKYEGLGNDFLVVEGRAAELPEAQIQRLCDRHFGVGADGILVVEAARDPSAAGRMVVLNADGSRPEMCGNGIRCVALYLAGKRHESSSVLSIETDAGPRVCRLEGGQVEVDMGNLVDEGPIELSVGVGKVRFARMSIGNPHAVAFESFNDEQIDRIGPVVSRHPAFPKGTNVEFARQAADGAIDLVVWERGVGRTLACGTGACATAAVACVAGKRPFDEPIVVRLPGGPLTVTVRRQDLSARMRGPARFVFRGEAELA